MDTIAKQLREAGVKIRESSGDYGLELELETLGVSDYPKKFLEQWYDIDESSSRHIALPRWKIVKDGSLRNFGREFIFAKPLSFEESFSAIDEFHEALGKAKFIDNAPNASVHVHVDMTKKTILQMANFITVYLIAENLLASFAGTSRWSNFFTLTCRDATKYAAELGRFIGSISRGHKPYIELNGVKYSALNIGRFLDLGTLEIRLMRSTADPQILKNWLSIIESMVRYAKKDTDPHEIFYKALGNAEELMVDVFGAYYDMLTNTPVAPRVLISSSMINVWQFIRQSYSWKDIDKAFSIKKSEIEDEFGPEINGPIPPDVGHTQGINNGLNIGGTMLIFSSIEDFKEYALNHTVTFNRLIKIEDIDDQVYGPFLAGDLWEHGVNLGKSVLDIPLAPPPAPPQYSWTLNEALASEGISETLTNEDDTDD